MVGTAARPGCVHTGQGSNPCPGCHFLAPDLGAPLPSCFLIRQVGAGRVMCSEWGKAWHQKCPRVLETVVCGGGGELDLRSSCSPRSGPSGLLA